MSIDDTHLPEVQAYLASLPNPRSYRGRRYGRAALRPAARSQIKSTHFNRYLWSEHPIVDEAVYYLVDSCCRGLIPERTNPKKLYATAKIILLNLYRAHKMGREHWVTYSRNKNVINTPMRYRKSGFSYPHLILLTDAFRRRQQIEAVKGFHDRSRRRNTPASRSKPSRMRIAEGIYYLFQKHQILPEYIIRDPRQELIELKDCAGADDRRPLLAYKNTVTVSRMRKVLEGYNALIKASAIELNGTHSPYIDFSDITVKRVFNNNSWTHGGRFYGGWWLHGIKSNARHNMTINGNPTVELDYKSLHPFMLYQREGIRLHFDPYQLPEYDNSPDKRKLRNLAKDFLLISLNADDEGKALKAIRNDIKEDKENEEGRYPNDIPDLSQMAVRLKEHNASIAAHFCKGEGLRLQYQDSRIAERIIKTMTGEGKVVLCLHDGFRCEVTYETQLRQLMADSYMVIMRTDYHPVIEVKLPN